jgi:hypothetical protein
MSSTPQRKKQKLALTIYLVLLVAFSSVVSSEQTPAEYIDGILVRTPQTGSVLAVGDVIYSVPSPTTGYTNGLAWDEEYLWVCDGFSGMIYRFDPWTGSVITSFSGPTSDLRDLAWDGSNLWVASWNFVPEPRRIYKLDPSDGSVIDSFPAPFSGHPVGLSWDGEYLWIGEEDGKIYKVDPSTGTVVYSFSVPYEDDSNPRGLAWDGEDIWAGYQSVGLIKEHDITTGSVLTSFGSPSGPYQQGLSWDGQYLWSTGGDNMIYQIDVGRLCLGTCCYEDSCANPIPGMKNITCKECIDTGNYWTPNKYTACFANEEPFDLCLNWCPECCDGEDNDYDGKIDFPADLECTCGLDPNETEPLPPIPELSTIMFFSVGLLVLTGYVVLRRKK